MADFLQTAFSNAFSWKNFNENYYILPKISIKFGTKLQIDNK